MADDSGLPQGFQLDEDRYGGAGGMAKAALLGAGRSATLGLSDVALTKTGLVNPETIKGLEEENPISSLAGETAGLFAPGGAAGLIGKAGKAVTGGIKALNVAKDAYEVSRAAKILGATADIGAHALGSSVEGAIYAGVGNSLHEYALGDPSLNGEKILANFGSGAIAGGLIGAGIKGAQIAVPAAVGGAKDALLKTREFLAGSGEGTGGLIGKGIEAAGSPEKAHAWANRITNLNVDQKIKIANEASDSLNDVWKNTDTALKTLNKEIRPQEVEALIGSANPEKVVSAQQNVINSLETAIQTNKARPVVYSQPSMALVDDIQTQIANGLKDQSPMNVYNNLKEAKQRLGKIISNLATSTAETKNYTLDLLRPIQDELNGALKNPEIFGDVGARLAEHDDILSKLYKFIPPHGEQRGQTDLQKYFMQKSGAGSNARWSFDPEKLGRAFKQAETIGGQKRMAVLDEFYDLLKKLPDHIKDTYGNVPTERFDKEALSNIIENSHSTIGDSFNKYSEAVQGAKSGAGLKDYATGVLAGSHPFIGAAVTAFNIIKNPIEYMGKLGGVEKAVGNVTKSIGQGAARIFDPAMNAAYRVKNPVIRETLDKHDYDKASENIKSLAHNPSGMMDTLSDSTKGFADAAPDTATHTQAASTRAVQFLASKLPPDTSLSPFDKKIEPSKTEMQNFNRYLKTVENPTSVLDHVANGTLGTQELETLKVVYPKLYEHMQASVLNHATAALGKDSNVPYRTKEMLSLFMGKPLDPSVMSQNVMRNQMAMSKPMQTPQQAGSKKMPASAKLGMSERTGLGGGSIDG